MCANNKMSSKGWTKIAIIALVVIGFWWLFVKKSGYSLCNLADYVSDVVQTVAPPGMVGAEIQSVADMTVPTATVVSGGMGVSTYARRGGCGCNK